MEEKRCWRCKETKHVSEFNRCRSRKDGLQAKCRNCRREYYQQNRERVSAQSEVYRKKNRDRILACNRDYFYKNRERLLAQMRARHATYRLKTLDALEALPSFPTDAQILSALSTVNTSDTSPPCSLADSLLSLAEAGAEEHEAKAEILAEVTPEWLQFQRDYQLKTIEEYNNEYPEYAIT